MTMTAKQTATMPDRPGFVTQAAALQGVDVESRTAEVVFSTGALVTHPVVHQGELRFMPTRVVVEEGAVDLEFLRASGPVLDAHQNHAAANVIGSVEDAWIADGEARARIRFADVPDVDPIWQRVRQGHLRNVSMGAYVLAQELRQEDGPDGPFDVMMFTRTQPVELSMVPVPGDQGARVQRASNVMAPAMAEAAHAAASMQQKEHQMEDHEQSVAQAAPEAAAPDMAPIQQQAPARTAMPDAAEIRRQAADAERDRLREITTVARQMGCEESMVTQAIDNGVTADDFRKQAIDAFVQRGQAATQGVAGPRATVTQDGHERFRQGAVLGVLARAGIAGGERNEFTGLTLADMARQSLDMAGVRPGADRREMIGRAFVQQAGSHSTSDFAHILANVANKAALKGWEEHEDTFGAWTNTGTLTDFKPARRVGLGLFPSLRHKPEGAEYKYADIGDRGEQIMLATYGEIAQITREAVINDDLALIAGLPRKMGRAASRTVGDLVYAILTANPAMADGTALFHADHNNLAGTPAALSVASLGAARAAMRTQKEKAGGPALNIRPAYLIIPAALETLARQLMTSTFDPTASKGHASNPVAGMAEIVVDGRLDAASATAWFLSASPGMFDTIEVAYLDGNAAPFIEEETAWTTDGVRLKVRIDAGVKALDHRTLYKNAGA
jgi:hypothetical protein